MPNNKLEVKVKKLRDDAVVPMRASEYAAGYDLYAAIDSRIVIAPGKTAMIGTGLAFEIPDGYFAGLYIRSGIAANRELRPANCVGICDSDYRGEYMFAIHNDSNENQAIDPGDRIGQMIVQPYNVLNVTVVDELSDTERAAGGFGSTGTK